MYAKIATRKADDFSTFRVVEVCNASVVNEARQAYAAANTLVFAKPATNAEFIAYSNGEEIAW